MKLNSDLINIPKNYSKDYSFQQHIQKNRQQLQKMTSKHHAYRPFMAKIYNIHCCFNYNDAWSTGYVYLLPTPR
jgi:hypothetical protein